MSENKNSDLKNLSFEAALKELENIVRGLETGGHDLDKSILQYERGTALRAHCEAKLKEAKMKVEKIVTNADGKIGTDLFGKKK